MSKAGDLAQDVAREAWVPFDRQQYDHDEMLLVVRENSKRHSEEIADVRSEVKQLETKLDRINSTINYVLWTTCLLLGAVAYTQFGFFKP